MAPDWEKLSDEWEAHETGLIAEVDCSSDGKPLCDDNGVKGFPTLKWGDPLALEDYKGLRDYNNLAKFADENLNPNCSPTNLELCDDKMKELIEKYITMSVDELTAVIQVGEEKIKNVENNFTQSLDGLHHKYKELEVAKEEATAVAKGAYLNLMKAVKESRSSGEKDEL